MKRMSAKLKKIIVISIVLLALILFFTLNRDVLDLLIDGDIEGIRALLAGKLLYAYIFMLVIMIVQNSFTIVPLILVITVNIALFGIVNGFLWSWITSVIAGVIVFFGVRYIFQAWLLKRVDPTTLTKIEQRGFFYVLQARVFPFVPTSLINILAGISTIRFFHFLLATAIGNFMYFFVLALVPAGILSSHVTGYEMGLILFLVVTVSVAVKKIYDKKNKQKSEKTASKKTSNE